MVWALGSFEQRQGAELAQKRRRGPIDPSTGLPWGTAQAASKTMSTGAGTWNPEARVASLNAVSSFASASRQRTTAINSVDQALRIISGIQKGDRTRALATLTGGGAADALGQWRAYAESNQKDPIVQRLLQKGYWSKEVQAAVQSGALKSRDYRETPVVVGSVGSYQYAKLPGGGTASLPKSPLGGTVVGQAPALAPRSAPTVQGGSTPMATALTPTGPAGDWSSWASANPDDPVAQLLMKNMPGAGGVLPGGFGTPGYGGGGAGGVNPYATFKGLGGAGEYMSALFQARPAFIQQQGELLGSLGMPMRNAVLAASPELMQASNFLQSRFANPIPPELEAEFRDKIRTAQAGRGFSGGGSAVFGDEARYLQGLAEETRRAILPQLQSMGGAILGMSGLQGPPELGFGTVSGAMSNAAQLAQQQAQWKSEFALQTKSYQDQLAAAQSQSSISQQYYDWLKGQITLANQPARKPFDVSRTAISM